MSIKTLIFGIIIAAAGTVLAVVVVNTFEDFDPITWLGGVSKRDFAGYENCAKATMIYVPDHFSADKKGCVPYGPKLGLFEHEEITVPVASFHKVFNLLNSSVIMVTASVTSKRDDRENRSYVLATIHVQGKLCSSDEHSVGKTANDGYTIHAAAMCVMTLPPGKHSLLVVRYQSGVKLSDTKLYVRYVVLSN